MAIIGDEVSCNESHTAYSAHAHAVWKAQWLTRRLMHLCRLSIALFQDTVTGFLLSGVGHRDNKNRVNYLVVDAERKCA